MNALVAGLVIVAVVAVATAVGLLWRSRNGRVRVTTGVADAAPVVRPSDVGLEARSESPFGSAATLLQFSTEFCAYCPQTRVLLGGLAAKHPGVEHVDIDLTRAPAIADRFKVLQTPTTLVLDGEGRIRARIGGAPRPVELAEQLDHILRSHNVSA